MNHIKVIPGSLFRTVLEELAPLPGAPSNIRSSSCCKDSGQSIDLAVSDIKWCHERIKERGISHRIHELLRSSEVILPEYEPPPRNPELEARVQRLRAQQENEAYRRMTQHLVVSRHEAANLRGMSTDVKEMRVQMREMNRYLITGAQYLLSIVGTFFAIFVGVSYVLNDYGVRVLLSTFCAVVVGLAELYFIIKQDMEEECKGVKKKLS